MKTLLLIILLAIVTGGLVHAQSTTQAQHPPVNLSFGPRPGEYLRITLVEKATDIGAPGTAIASKNSDTSMNLKATSAPRKLTVTAKEIGYDWKIQDRNPRGNTVITISYAFVSVRITVGSLVRYSAPASPDFDVLDEGPTFAFDTRLDVDMSNPELAELNRLPANSRPAGVAKLIANLEWARNTLDRALVGRPFTIEVSPRGQVLAVHGMELIMDGYRAELSKRKVELAERAQQDALIEAFFGEDTITKTLTQIMLLPYPGQALHSGDTWSDKSEIELFGMTLPVTRQLRLDSDPGANGRVPLSGVIKVELPSEKDGLIIDARSATRRVSAVVDPATGMYDKLEYEDNFDIVARDPKAGTDVQPQLLLDLKSTSRVTVARLGRWDPRDKEFWLFEGDNGALQVRLGPNWAPVSLNGSVGAMLISTFQDSVTDSHLATTTNPISPQYETQHPLSRAADEAKALIESTGHRRGKLVWIKTLETGSVRWTRFRIDINETDGQLRTYWGQSGYGPQRRYLFELTRHGAPSSASDSDANQILDNISVKE